MSDEPPVRPERRRTAYMASGSQPPRSSLERVQLARVRMADARRAYQQAPDATNLAVLLARMDQLDCQLDFMLGPHSPVV
jgi:hypothetical protein